MRAVARIVDTHAEATSVTITATLVSLTQDEWAVGKSFFLICDILLPIAYVSWYIFNHTYAERVDRWKRIQQIQNARAEPILPGNQIEVMITEVSARDYSAEAETTEVKAQAIASEEEVTDGEPPVAQVPQWLEQIKKRATRGKIEPYTPVPGIRIRRVKGELKLTYNNNE